MEIVDIILGITSGSLGTVIIGKISDVFMAKAALKREMKRQFFASKLQIAEKAMNYYMSVYDSFIVIQKSIEPIIREENVDENLFQELYDFGVKKLLELRDDSSLQLNSIRLFFDFKDCKSYPKDNEARLLKACSDFNLKNKKQQELYKIMDEKGKSEQLKKELEVNMREGRVNIIELNNCLTKEIERAKYISDQLREEMKKFEY